MTKRFANNFLGLAAAAILLLIPAGAHAACANSVSLSYGATSVAKAGGTGSVSVIAPAGCPWVVVGHEGWIQIISADRGSGNGTVTFRVLANGTRATRVGTFGSAIVCYNDGNLGGRSAISVTTGCYSAYAVRVTQSGQ